MKPRAPISRRDFIAGTSALLLAGEFSAEQPQSVNPPGRLAMDGGEKAVKKPATRPVRWGDPELQQFTQMLKQDSLLYWKAPQTTLLVERFKEVCPSKYVMNCSSGTAALHIAVAA